jgi:signal transduction histidine kinase
MTVTLLHISAARLALQDQPASVDDAIDALREAETQGRRSLADIRQTVGLLASDDPAESALGPPVPGVEDLPDLVSSYEAAGLTIDLDVRGDLARLSPAGGVTLYRVLQEGLANAAKHAPGAPVAVRLFVHRRKVAVCVNNGLSPHAPLAPPGGRGVAGMTDRVRQLGGRLRAGPTADGWQLRADLPLSSGWGSFGASCADDSEPVSVDQS